MSESSARIEEDSLRNALERQKNLQRHFAEVRQRIDTEFDNVSKALEKRREVLVRQFEALQRQQLSLLHSSPDFNEEHSCVTVEFNGQNDILEFLANFGGIRAGRGSNIYDIEPCKLEEFREREFYFDKEIEGSGNSNVQWSTEGRVEESDGATPNLSIQCIPSCTKEEFVGSSANLSGQCETSFNSDSNNVDNANSNKRTSSDASKQCEPSIKEKRESINVNNNDCTRIRNNSDNINPNANSSTNESTNATDVTQATNGDDSDSTSKNNTSDNNNTTIYSSNSDVSTIIISNTDANCDNQNKDENMDISIKIESNCELSGAPPKADDNRSEITSNGYGGTEVSCENVSANGNKEEIPREHPEQVKQWLEQILLETDLEPSVNEVERINLRQVLIN